MFHRGGPVNSCPFSGMPGIQQASLIPSGWVQGKARSETTEGHLSRRSDRQPAKPTRDQSAVKTNRPCCVLEGGLCFT